MILKKFIIAFIVCCLFVACKQKYAGFEQNDNGLFYHKARARARLCSARFAGGKTPRLFLKSGPILYLHCFILWYNDPEDTRYGIPTCIYMKIMVYF